MSIGKTIVKMQFGSHVYGTSLPTSDTDYKAVFIPPARDILLQRVRNSVLEKTNTTAERNTAADTDFEAFSLQQFMRLLLEGQTIALDMLFTPDRWIVESSPLWDQIREMRPYWLHRGASAFVGYCRQQASKYGIRGSRVAAVRCALDFLHGLEELNGPTTKLAEVWEQVEMSAAGQQHMAIVVGEHSDGRKVRMLEVCGRKVQEHLPLKEARKVFQLIMDNYGQRALQAEQNQGVDWKALTHAVRVIGEARELLATGIITFPRPDADQLLEIRKGELPYSAVSQIIEEGMEQLDSWVNASALPERPDRERADSLVADAYWTAIVRDGFDG